MSKSNQAKSKSKSARVQAISKQSKQKSSFWDIFKFGESYTSLFLGIVVVIVATVLLLSFVKGKNISSNQVKNITQNEQAETANEIAVASSDTGDNSNGDTKAVEKAKAQPISGSKYTVKEGDTLWKIAESKYKSGYNWVDIQKANNIANADVLNVGVSIKLPNVQPKIATVVESKNIKQTTVSSIQVSKIDGNNYTIAKGDTLWDIAVRAYGDGYAWPKIAKANNLSYPNLIYSGSKLIIPRG